MELSLCGNVFDSKTFKMPVNGFAANTTSLPSLVQNAQVKCDLVTLDSGLNEPYIKLVGNTGKKPAQTVTNQTVCSINNTKPFTLLKSVFVSL